MPHTAGEVAPTPGSSAGSLHVEVPPAALSRPFGCCPQFKSDNLQGGKGRRHIHSDQASMVAAEPLKYFFGQKFFHGDGSVTVSIVVM